MARTQKSGLDEFRVLVRPPAPISAGSVTRIVKSELDRTRWGGDRAVRSSAVDAPETSSARNDVIVRIEATETTKDAMAAHAHELVQQLYDTDRFLRVEADIPTPAFDPAGLTTTQPAAPTGPGPLGVRTDCSDVGAAARRDWALKAMRVPEALELMDPATRGGKGILVGHPDSGYSDHPLLGRDRLDLARDRDVISDDHDARDPLRPPEKSIFRPLPNPGHGTSTASVLVGEGEGGAAGQFRGVATEATLVPIRATESVVQVFDNDVGNAVRWAHRKGCHIVSMSLGGKGLFGLEDAIQDAVDDGMIVMAAAGNQVGFVTAPASYGNCIAVAATSVDSKPWAGSSRGPEVNVAAPGSCVWAALFEWDQEPPDMILGQSNGTSYAVAHLAGIAALWLAHHGHQHLVDRYGKANVQAVLLHQLAEPKVSRRPPRWDRSSYGHGIINAAELLAAELPPVHHVVATRGPSAAVATRPAERLAGSAGVPSDEFDRALDRLLGPGSSSDPGLVRRFEGELAYHLADPETRRALLGRSRSSAQRSAALRGASPQLQERIAGRT